MTNQTEKTTVRRLDKTDLKILSILQSMSNCLVNFFSETLAMGGINRQVSNLAGVQLGVVTYRGCLVDKAIATKLGMPSLDLGMLFTQSN